MTTRISAQRVVKAVRDRERREKRVNRTFRMRKELAESFKTKCARERIKMVDVLEELITAFIEEG